MKLLKGEVRTTESVTDADIEFIFDTLYKDYYEGVTYKGYFLEHFREKDYVLLFSIDGIIKGFSLQQVIPVTLKDKEIIVLWAGDVLIHPDFWGKNDYRYQLSQLCLKLYNENPNKLVFRLGTPKGYKTFKTTPNLFRTYYPSPEADYYPELETSVIDIILSAKYPPSVYDKKRMLLLGCEDGHRLKDGFAQVTEEELKKPLVKFFYEKNPGYAKGDELPLIAPVTPANLKPLQRYSKHIKRLLEQEV